MILKTVTEYYDQNNSKVSEFIITPISSDLNNLPKAEILAKSLSEAQI
ncbi:11025_t:CDS:1, partial [Ambispora gerdemannii]